MYIASMYPEEMVRPMESELTSLGFKALKRAADVDAALSEAGLVLLVINSVCGCAAGGARPGVAQALARFDTPPARLCTVFAGVDTEAVAQARTHTLPYPPSSPSVALFKDGTLVHFVARHQIEGQSAAVIAAHLQEALAKHQ